MLKLKRVFLTVPLLWLMCSPLSSFAQGNTRLLIGLAGETPNERVQGIDIYTSQIDAAIDEISNLPHVPIDFGNNYTSSLAASAFAQYDNALNDLEAAIANELNSSNLTVTSISLESEPFHLQLFQQYGNVGAQLGTFTLNLSVRYCITIAGCAYVDARVDDISATAEYNVITGKFENYNVSYDVAYVNTTGQSFLISIGRFLGIDNAPNSDGDLQSDLRSMIEQELDGFGEKIEDTEVFNLDAFLTSAKLYVENATLPTLPSYLPPITEGDRNKALEGIAHIRAFIDQATFQGSGTQLNFVINRPAISNGYERSVEIIASHVDSKIHGFEYYTTCGEVSYSPAPQSFVSKLYSKHYSAPWVLENTGGPFDPLLYIDNAQSGMKLVVIPKNALIGNLYGYPSRLNTYIIDDIYSGTGGFQPINQTIGECGSGGGDGFPGGGGFPGFP